MNPEKGLKTPILSRNKYPEMPNGINEIAQHKIKSKKLQCPCSKEDIDETYNRKYIAPEEDVLGQKKQCKKCFSPFSLAEIEETKKTTIYPSIRSGKYIYDEYYDACGPYEFPTDSHHSKKVKNLSQLLLFSGKLIHDNIQNTTVFNESECN